MVFALEEINNSTALLPGVKLGFHIFDCCGQPPWAPQAALSLAGGGSSKCNLNDGTVVHGEGVEETGGSMLYIYQNDSR